MLGINTNVASLNAQKNLNSSAGQLNTAIARLSSGLRVNSSKDDAAGLAVAERMQAQITGFDTAARNASDGTSFLQVADSAMGKISDNLQRMRELAVQSKNGTLNVTDRANLDREYTALADEVGRVATGTTFNEVDVFAAANKTLSLQIGAGNAVTDTLTVNLTSTALAAGNDLQTQLGGATSALIVTAMRRIDTVANATAAITEMDTSINDITNFRATVGASLSRLEQITSLLGSNSLNLTAARGRIMDADFAKETARLTRTQILQQAGTATLAQANQIPNNVLSLLR